MALVSRRTLWRSPAPLLASLSIYTGLLALWQFALVPHLPPTPERATPEHEVRVKEFAEIGESYWVSAQVESADVLFVGDSRAAQSVVFDVMETAGLGQPGIMWDGLAQLPELLEATLQLEAPRVVVGLSPISIYTPRPSSLRALELFSRELPFTDYVEAVLRQGFRARRSRLVRVIGAGQWQRSWLKQASPDANTPVYTKQLGPATHAKRTERLAEVELALERLLADGREVVCVRYPIAPQLFAVEDANLPSAELAAVPERLGIVLFDYVQSDFATHDGSHLMSTAAVPFSRLLAGDLGKLAGWRLPDD